MPTFRDDIKLGTKVPMMKTDDYNDQSVTEEKLKDGAITTRKIADGSVTKDKLDSSIRQEINESVTASNEATEKAKEATVKADQATENAKQATAAATAAKEAADTATQLATNATTASNQATEQAKAATTKAEEATAKANEAAQKADDSREQTEQTLGTMQEVIDKTAIKDEEGTLVETPFRYIQNEEFIFAKVDAEDKLLFGIQWDGTPVFGKTSAVEDRLQSQVTLLAERVATIIGDEDTTNVIDTMNELKKFFAEIENTQNLTSILANLNSLNTKFGEDIKNLQDTKVDKEEGKSLIEDEVKECFRVVENKEFIKAIVDAEDKILFGFYRATGKPYYPLNEMYHVIQNKEYFAAWLDEADHVLLGIRRDGEIIGEIHAVNALKQVISQLQADLASLQEKVGTIDTNLKELLDVFSLQENPEYLAVEQDAEGKVLSATYIDGSHYSHNLKSESIDAKVDKKEGKSLIDSDVADANFTIEDPEGRTEITTDAEGKLLGYRDSEGTRHEHKISINHLELSDEAATEVNEAFKSAGIKMENPSDFSKDSYVELPIPRIAAQVRIYAPKLPTTKQDDIAAEIEYNDKDGNYFRKPAILNIQGDSSVYYPVKNMAIDIDDGSMVKFGDFPSQDSFHLKKYYIDIFRGQCIVGYWLMEQVYTSRNLGKQYPYEQLYNGVTSMNGYGEIKKDFFTGAKCHPDGFPITIIWVNTTTNEEKKMGIYTWNLKKSKEVYFADKKSKNNIILDGLLNESIFNGTVNWSAFEIRNPKKLKDIDGNDYDGENPKELSETDKFSKAVKDSILRLSSAAGSIRTNLTKKTFEEYFIRDSFIDYYIVAQVLHHGDGFAKNWIWITWDGKKWTPTIYDLDSIFGQTTNGCYVEKNTDTDGIVGDNILCPLLKQLYVEEIKSRYAELRKSGVFSVGNIVSLLQKWCIAVGYENYKEELDLYPETPSYRNDYLNENWEVVTNVFVGSDDYNITKTYNVGDTCIYKMVRFKAKNTTTGVPPVDKVYINRPYALGFHNSVQRVSVWLTNRIAFLDTKYNFNQ